MDQTITDEKNETNFGASIRRSIDNPIEIHISAT